MRMSNENGEEHDKGSFALFALILTLSYRAIIPFKCTVELTHSLTPNKSAATQHAEEPEMFTNAEECISSRSRMVTFPSTPTMSTSVDASNSCIPPSSPLLTQVPPLPSTTRGEPCVLSGEAGRLNATEDMLLYTSGKLVVLRSLKTGQCFCYRGHTSQVTAAAFSPSGAYVASADARGKLRVWSYDNEEHLAKLELQALTGPVRGIAWDVDSKRVSIS